MRPINQRQKSYVAPTPAAHRSVPDALTRPAVQDILERKDNAPAPFKNRGTHLPPRSRRKIFVDNLQRAGGAVLRSFAKIINAVLPFSILTDTIVLPSWAMGADSLGTTPDKLKKEAEKLQRQYKGTPITIPVRNYAFGVPVPGPQPLLDGMHFPAPDPATKKTVIFCNPNAMFWEQSKEVVDFYNRELGCNVVVFNYRGVSQSTGRPTISRTQKDMDSVLKMVKETWNVSDKDILVHGRSVGGPHAAYIASKHPEMTLVCDRTFTNLASAAKNMVGGGAKGNILGGLAYTFAADDVSTHTHFQKAKGPKLCIADHHDEMFPNYRGEGGDVIDLNRREKDTHNDFGTTFRSRLVRKWITKTFVRR